MEDNVATLIPRFVVVPTVQSAMVSDSFRSQSSYHSPVRDAVPTVPRRMATPSTPTVASETDSTLRNSCCRSRDSSIQSELNAARKQIKARNRQEHEQVLQEQLSQEQQYEEQEDRWQEELDTYTQQQIEHDGEEEEEEEYEQQLQEEYDQQRRHRAFQDSMTSMSSIASLRQIQEQTEMIQEIHSIRMHQSFHESMSLKEIQAQTEMIQDIHSMLSIMLLRADSDDNLGSSRRSRNRTGLDESCSSIFSRRSRKSKHGLDESNSSSISRRSRKNRNGLDGSHSSKISKRSGKNKNVLEESYNSRTSKRSGKTEKTYIMEGSYNSGISRWSEKSKNIIEERHSSSTKSSKNKNILDESLSRSISKKKKKKKKKKKGAESDNSNSKRNKHRDNFGRVKHHWWQLESEEPSCSQINEKLPWQLESEDPACNHIDEKVPNTRASFMTDLPFDEHVLGQDHEPQQSSFCTPCSYTHRGIHRSAGVIEQGPYFHPGDDHYRTPPQTFKPIPAPPLWYIVKNSPLGGASTSSSTQKNPNSTQSQCTSLDHCSEGHSSHRVLARISCQEPIMGRPVLKTGTPKLSSPDNDTPLSISALASASPGSQKKIIGERLYHQIHKSKPDLAGRITSILMESDNCFELLNLIESPGDIIDNRINEVLDLLDAYNATGTPTCISSSSYQNFMSIRFWFLVAVVFCR